jgi:peptide/nickel transport system permease protein
MFVGLGAPAIALVLSTVIGCTSGYLGGRVDMVIQRFVDAIMCFPGLIILLTVIAITGPGLIQIILVLGILGGIGGQVRVVRSAVLGIKGSVYVEAAKAVGSPDGRTLLRHILPNVMAPVIIIFTTSMGGAILTEASLSFLGYGIPPPEPSWGGMLSREARVYMEQAPWLALWPGLALAAVVWGINMLGDGLRDVLDPRLIGGRTGRYKTKMAKKLAKATQEK